MSSRRAVRAIAAIAAIAWVPSSNAAASPQPADSDPGAPTVRRLEIRGAIQPITGWMFDRVVADAEAAGDDLVLVELDTPGGLVTTTDAIVQRMFASEVPIVVYVGPAGAHAASAGFYLLLAADVAAMAPATRTGAAAAVFLDGPSVADDLRIEKINQDSAASIRAICEHRGRNVEAAEQAVLEARAYTESAALGLDLIDLVAPDVQTLLRELDGREIRRFDGSSRTLRTAGAVFVETEIDFKGWAYAFLTRPTVAAILLLLAIAGLYMEFHAPGTIVPGVVGGIALILFLISATALPISAIGVLLMIVGVLGFVVEAKFGTFGLSAAVGLVCLASGALMLVDGPVPALRVAPLAILPTTVVVGALLAVVAWKVRAAFGARVSTGREGLVGAVGTVTTPLDPVGKIDVAGELWNASVASGSLGSGARVRVVEVRGLELVVRAESSNGTPEG